MNIIHLLSGGLDSVTMLYEHCANGHNVRCLCFDYRQRHKQELLWAKMHADKCRVLYTTMDLPELGGLTEQSWIVPNRNACFLAVAVNFAAQCGFSQVSIGCNADDASYFPDCREEFLSSFNTMTRLGGYEVDVIAPYLNKSKLEIGSIAKRFGITKSTIWTCYKPTSEGPCGECPACKKLEEAMLYVDSK